MNGYYSNPEISTKLNTFKKNLTPVLKEEYLMFIEIENTLFKKGVKFQSIDSNKVIGWFKYEF